MRATHAEAQGRTGKLVIVDSPVRHGTLLVAHITEAHAHAITRRLASRSWPSSDPDAAESKLD